MLLGCWLITTIIVGVLGENSSSSLSLTIHKSISAKVDKLLVFESLRMPSCVCRVDPPRHDMESMDPSRAFVKDVKRIVIKVGTSVVTRSDGRLALGRLGVLCEQIKELNAQGYEIILVTSGAVGLGRQRLGFRKFVCSSFYDLRKPQEDLDVKACAAVGQTSLMAVYDMMFSELDVTSSQVLVTEQDFSDKKSRKQTYELVESLVDSKVIPIFNENDAIISRRVPDEDSSGIFSDNDSLASILATEIGADILFLLSDVEGLYSGPPSDPNSQLIHTYIKDVHEKTVRFGAKSRSGRGGMTAKVFAAVSAASAGIPVVITSGKSTTNIIEVLEGKLIGTLFHRDAHLWTVTKEFSACEMAIAARESSRLLQSLESQDRTKLLRDIANALLENQSLIQDENDADVAAAVEAGYEKSLVSRLALKPGKISALAKSICKLADMEEPIGRVISRTELADGLVLEKTSSPLGVLLVIFESRPDALVQIVSLAIRSGNGVLLKGGKEARRSNAVLHKIITSVIPDTVGKKLVGLVTSREDIPDLLKLDDVIDLVIPRGSNNLVSQIKDSTKIPMLGHADGVCHIYIDASAKMSTARRIVRDAKIDYPAACNAMETLLIHKDFAKNGGLNELIEQLQEEGVTLYGGPLASALLSIPEALTFHHEYNSMACTIEIVDDVKSAIDHIHQHGSGHTECIVAEDRMVAETFLHQVDSASVFHNASTRFCDGARFGLGAEVGISTSRIHARGPVGVEGLLTTKWILRGIDHVVDGDKGVTYTHKDLSLLC